MTDLRGYYEKFEVYRTDGDPDGKHDGCEYFVLDLTHDQHAVAALQAYRDAIREDRPVLWAELGPVIDDMKQAWLSTE